MKYVLSIDQGTTGTRAMIFNKNGEEIAKSYLEHKQIFPKPGWVEHDPTEIWLNTIKVIKDSINLANLSSRDLLTIGITNQRETIVAWDKNTGKPIHNAIVWQCRRTADYCDSLREAGYEELIKNKTGLVLDPYFSGTKIQWLLKENDKISGIEKKGNLLVGTIDSWLIWNLTGSHITDFSNASRTLLFNIHKGEWDKDLLEIFSVPLDILPEVRPSSDPDTYGFTKSELLGEEIPVSGSAGDQQAALFGQNCFKKGEIKNTYGTGNFMLLNTGNEAVNSNSGLLTTIAWKINNEIIYALEGSVFITGAAIQWLENGIQILENKSDLTLVMNQTKNTDGVYLVPAFVGLGAPYWDPHARGTIIGITRGTDRNHLIRATLESICYQSEDIFRAMSVDSGTDISMIRVDGGVTNCLPLLQFQSNISNVTVQKPKIAETTALGAAYLAGLAVGYWKNLEDINNNFLIDKQFYPMISKPEREELMRNWRKAVERSRKWID